MKTYDTHAHLDQLGDLDAVMVRAERAGVLGIMAVSMDLESCRRNLAIGKQFAAPKVYVGLGMHPSEADPQTVDGVIDLARQHADEIHAVGEIGLDFWYKWVRKDEGKKNEQREVYRKLLALAKELDKPAVIHSRGAWRECLDAALEVGVAKAEFHWYSGPLDVLDDLLKAGYYVSTSPSVAYSEQSRQAMGFAPIERTLIETDCPVTYADPATGTQFQAEPKDVFRTLEAYAALKGLPAQDSCATLNRNAKDFFNLN
jgi:TatD DNase family protein